MAPIVTNVSTSMTADQTRCTTLPFFYGRGYYWLMRMKAWMMVHNNNDDVYDDGFFRGVIMAGVRGHSLLAGR